MANYGVSDQVVLDRMRAAQEIEFDLKSVCGDKVFHTVDAHSRAIGAPHPFIFFPLLTVIASCLGVKAVMEVNEEWKEPAILWTVVAARKGEKKTPACKRLTAAVAKLEEEIQESVRKGESKGNQDEESSDDEHATAPKKPISPDKLPQLLVDYFSFEELYNLMSRSGCQVNI